METSKISLKDNENRQHDNNTHFKRKKNNSSTSGVVVSEERCRVFQTPKQIKPSNTTAPNTLLATPSSFWNKYTSKSNDETGILDSADKVSNSHNNYQTPKLCTNPYANRTTSSLKSHYSRNNNNAYTPSSLSSSYHTAIKKGTTTNNNSKPESRIICTVSENLARETCIATIDLSSTSVLTVTKQGNGQTYAETMSFLEHIQPDEVLLNEGRRNSQLVKKIIELFQPQDGNDQEHDDDYIGDIPQTYTTGKHRKRRRKLNASNKNMNDKSSLKDTAKDMSGEPSSQTVVKFIPRSYFDQTKGAELLSRVCRDGFYDASVVEEYIFLSASYAILQYMQIFLGANFCRNTLTLELNWGGRNRMAIDRSTLMHLELLANAKTGKAKNSLIGTIDCTKTSVGSRLLRSNLMAPPTRVDTINARLELVQSFLEDEAFFYEVMEQLHALPDVDKMLAHMALIPREIGERRGKGKHEVTARMASRGISALVCIKSTLSVIPNFARVLEIQLKAYFRRENHQKNHGTMLKARTDDGNNDEGTEEDSSASSDDCYDEEINTCSSSLLLGLGSGPITNNASVGRHELLKSILITMKQPALKEILDSVLDIFTESTSYTRNTHVMKHQECFALKPNTDGMMDVMRKALLANIDDIYKLADEYAEKFGFTVTVKETTARGYYLSIPAHAESNLPDIFIQPVKVGRFINCTTEQVTSLNLRAQENVQDLLLITHERIQQAIDAARQKYDALAALSDAVALLDMCHCFADNVATSRLPWCRPIVTDYHGFHTTPNLDQPLRQDFKEVCGSGAIAIRNGRYAIDVSGSGLVTSDGMNSSGHDFIPNDTYASAFQNFTIITGINGSGKSTYLKQIAMSVILAQCGSYIPAEEALIPIRDRLCTRLGTSDDQEHNISTFMQEMKETAFICKNATDRSLILIDELGRATSNEDGVAIAWSIAEFLLTKRAMTFFVTHYHQISKMASVYPNVQNQHLGTVVENSNGEVRYTHKIFPGPCLMSADYGVEMAASCGWQEDVINMARSIRIDVEKRMPDGLLCNQNISSTSVDSFNIRHKAESILSNIAKHLVALKDNQSRLHDTAKKTYLQDLRSQFHLNDDHDLIQMVKTLLLDHDEVATTSLPLQSESLLKKTFAITPNPADAIVTQPNIGDIKNVEVNKINKIRQNASLEDNETQQEKNVHTIQRSTHNNSEREETSYAFLHDVKQPTNNQTCQMYRKNFRVDSTIHASSKSLKELEYKNKDTYLNSDSSSDDSESSSNGSSSSNSSSSTSHSDGSSSGSSDTDSSDSEESSEGCKMKVDMSLN